MQELQQIVDAAFERRQALSATDLASLEPHIEEGLAALDRGAIRAARPEDGDWVAEPWVKKLILLSFLTGRFEMASSGPGRPRSYDKLPLKFEHWDEGDFGQAGIRVVPGAVVRRGAHVAPGAILMPCFVNIGAHVGEGTMIDTWATVGSCAQVGNRCHISGGAGIGGVLEPLGDVPVVIEDDVFIGARAEIAEGVRVRRGAVIGMGVFLGRSTPVIERESGKVTTGEVPENAVVVPGARSDPNRPEISTYAAVIVKYADDRTRGKTALNALVRETRQ
jgi:2,3,4,5-tetrahydropyridine-2-carboxylate N-succinyltransferase/putative acetyltransferase